MRMWTLRLAARAMYEWRTVCFACGKAGEKPCPGHGYGGMIQQPFSRRWVPYPLLAIVDCRWARPGWTP